MKTNELSERDLESISGGTMSVHDWIGGYEANNQIIVCAPGEACGAVYKKDAQPITHKSIYI